VTLRWVEPIRTGTDHHMCGVRNDTLRAGVMVTAVSQDDTSARRLKNRITAALTGYRPPDCGEMMLEGGLSHSTANTDPKPTTYSRMLAYTFMTNLSPNDPV